MPLDEPKGTDALVDGKPPGLDAFLEKNELILDVGIRGAGLEVDFWLLIDPGQSLAHELKIGDMVQVQASEDHGYVVGFCRAGAPGKKTRLATVLYDNVSGKFSTLISDCYCLVV